MTPARRWALWWPASALPFARLRASMGLVLATTAGVIVWIVLWSLGAKSFDAFLLTVLFMVLGVGGRVLSAYLPGRQE